MTRAIKTMLLLVGATLLVAGCSKQDVFGGKYSRKAGDPVVFGVKSSSEIGTRTEYRNVTTYPTNLAGKTIQPIDWIQGDMIRIYSPDCKRASWNQPQQWADYKIKSVKASQDDPTVSLGTLENVQEVGLAWADAGNHTFYGIYPSPATTEGDTPDGTTGKFAYTIPDAQEIGAQMSYAFMTGAAAANAGVTGDAVLLEFTPGFTAFKIQMTLAEPTIIHGFEMNSTSTNLAGACTVTYTGVTPGYACASDKKKITVDFNDKQYAANASFEIILFAAPIDLKDLSISFNVSTPGSTNPARTHTLALKYGTNPPAGHTAGETVVFGATKMHVLKGIVTPNSTRIIEVNSQVVDWRDAGGMVIDLP